MTELAGTAEGRIAELETAVAVLEARLDAAERARDEAQARAETSMRTLKTSAQAQVRALNDRAARISRLESESRDLQARLRAAEAALAEAQAGGGGNAGAERAGPGAAALVAGLGPALDGLEPEEAVPACLVLTRLMIEAGAEAVALDCLAEAAAHCGEDAVLRAQVARGFLSLGRPDRALECLVAGALAGFDADEAETLGRVLRRGVEASR